MARVKGGTVARARRKKVLKEASGYFGSKHRLFKTAKEQLLHSGVYAYRDRRQKKRDFRKLWITRINAACRENEISYSKFIDGLNKAGLTVNRKMLSELAIDNPKAFSDLVIIAKDALNGKEYKPSKVVLESKKDDKKIVKETKTATKKVEAKEEKTTKGTTKKATTKKATTKKEEK
jgi:large subunit ribosomal protein L20